MRALLLLAAASAALLGPAAGFGPNLPNATQIESAVLTALNGIKDTAINPAIHNEIPNPIAINVEKKADSGSTCIVPGPFHSCICHASAGYDATLDQLQNINTVHVDQFKTVSATADPDSKAYHLLIAASFGATNMEADGHAHAACSACGISPSASGTASTEIDAAAVLSLVATGTYNSSSSCVKVAVTTLSLTFSEVNIHDTNVKISLGPIPGVSIGSLAGLVTEMVPDLTSVVNEAVQAPVSSVVPGVINSELPCVPIPTAAGNHLPSNHIPTAASSPPVRARPLKLNRSNV